MRMGRTGAGVKEAFKDAYDHDTNVSEDIKRPVD
jgi:hypothetical protein